LDFFSKKKIQKKNITILYQNIKKLAYIIFFEYFLKIYLIWIFLKKFQKFQNSKFRNFFIKKTTLFQPFGLAVAFQKRPQFSIQITHVTNR